MSDADKIRTKARTLVGSTWILSLLAQRHSADIICADDNVMKYYSFRRHKDLLSDA